MSMSVTKSNITTHITDSLGQLFIARKLSEYVEPVRKGALRGSVIGMNRCKYAAALTLAIYDLSSAEAAMIVKTSARLVSKWRTEQLFNNVVKQLGNEFCKEIERGVSKEISSAEVFADAALYNPEVKSEILTLCDHAAAQREGDKILHYWPLIRILLHF